MNIKQISELKVTFDGSTNPGIVECNGFVARFDSDEDAKGWFHLLGAIINAAVDARARFKKVSIHTNSLLSVVESSHWD